LKKKHFRNLFAAVEPMLDSLCCVMLFSAAAAAIIPSHEYCIIGAGPGGLQLGHLLLNSDRDYIIFDGSAGAGSFFEANPVHRTLISLNKRFTGYATRSCPSL
jgi:hypothetical protein